MDRTQPTLDQVINLLKEELGRSSDPLANFKGITILIGEYGIGEFQRGFDYGWDQGWDDAWDTYL